jgi:hypothetical protein
VVWVENHYANLLNLSLLLLSRLNYILELRQAQIWSLLVKCRLHNEPGTALIKLADFPNCC